ncbi:MAG: hypothetical protein ABI880_11890, partial [Acidobacteriota bacterium]
MTRLMPAHLTVLAVVAVVSLSVLTPAVCAQALPSITEYSLPPDTLAKSEALYRTRVAMFAVGTIYSVALLLLVLALRVAPRLRDRAERTSARRFVQ